MQVADFHPPRPGRVFGRGGIQTLFPAVAAAVPNAQL
jgi:hypothetical protein